MRNILRECVIGQTKTEPVKDDLPRDIPKYPNQYLKLASAYLSEPLYIKSAGRGEAHNSS